VELNFLSFVTKLLTGRIAKLVQKWDKSWMARVLFPTEEIHFSVLRNIHSIQTSSGVHPDSYPAGTLGSVLKVKVVWM
jgi:hypothetical protein